MRGSWTRPLAGLSPRSSAALWVASFVAPIAIWCVVSYVPFIWHPMVRVTDPGDITLDVARSAGRARGVRG